MTYLKRFKMNRLVKKLKSMQANRINNQPGDEILKKEVSFYFELAAMYGKLKYNKKFPFAEVMHMECYRMAASLNDAEANFRLGKMILEQAQFRKSIEQEGIFNSEFNEKECKRLFEEAHAYLLAAIKLGHIEAKRLRGLCFINAWGVSLDKKTGFELIVSSIEQEGAWDNVPELFASMGLNKPEFFAEIMQRRKSI